MNLFCITLSAQDLWLLGIAGSLCIVLINYWLANTRDKINRRTDASDNFNSEILDLLEGLYPLPFNWPKGLNDIDITFRDIFPKMQIAVESFRRFLPWYKRPFFDHAWQNFRNAYGGEQDIQCYHHYMAFGSNPDYKEVFKHNVDNLLKYAKIT